MTMQLSTDTSHLTAELDAAIAGLGSMGDQLVHVGAIHEVAAWLGRPAWLLEGVTIPIDAAELPAMIPLRDDVRIAGNLLINVGFSGLVTLFTSAMQWPARRLTGLLTSFAPNLGAGVDACIELTNLRNPHLAVISRVEGESRSLDLRENVDLGPAGLVVALTFAMQTHRLLQSRALPTPGQVDFGFAWAGPEDPAQVPDVPWATFHFGQATNSVTYPQAWDQQRNPLHDPLLWDVALRKAHEQGAIQREAAVVSRVRRLVADAIGADQRPPSLRSVASRLGKSERSLERNLTQAGASFRRVVEEERKRLAAALLSDSARTIQEVSDLLGFSDRTSFTRSFRSWFKVPPATFRLQLQTAGFQAS